MIRYDVHTHIGLDAGFYFRGWWPYASTAADLLLVMDQHDIDRAVCFPFGLPSAFDTEAFVQGRIELRPDRFPFDRENHLLAQELERIDQDRRLRMLAMFDPNRKIDEQLRSLEKFKGRITGLKLQATIIQSEIEGLLGPGRALMEMAAEQDWPVLFHTSISPNDPWSPARTCLDIAAANPKVRFNLAHSLRFHVPSLREAAQLPNVWVDCSAHLAHCDGARKEMAYVAVREERVDANYERPAEVLEAVAAIVGDCYMWGSDNPFMSWCDDRIRAVFRYREEVEALTALPESLQKSMCETAPMAWLGETA